MPRSAGGGAAAAAAARRDQKRCVDPSAGQDVIWVYQGRMEHMAYLVEDQGERKKIRWATSHAIAWIDSSTKFRRDLGGRASRRRAPPARMVPPTETRTRRRRSSAADEEKVMTDLDSDDEDEEDNEDEDEWSIAVLKKERSSSINNAPSEAAENAPEEKEEKEKKAACKEKKEKRKQQNSGKNADADGGDDDDEEWEASSRLKKSATSSKKAKAARRKHKQESYDDDDQEEEEWTDTDRPKKEKKRAKDAFQERKGRLRKKSKEKILQDHDGESESENERRPRKAKRKRVTSDDSSYLYSEPEEMEGEDEEGEEERIPKRRGRKPKKARAGGYDIREAVDILMAEAKQDELASKQKRPARTKLIRKKSRRDKDARERRPSASEAKRDDETQEGANAKPSEVLGAETFEKGTAVAKKIPDQGWVSGTIQDVRGNFCIIKWLSGKSDYTKTSEVAALVYDADTTRYPIGTRVKRRHINGKKKSGHVVSLDDSLYHILWKNDTTEVMGTSEMDELMARGNASSSDVAHSAARTPTTSNKEPKQSAGQSTEPEASLKVKRRSSDQSMRSREPDAITANIDNSDLEATPIPKKSKAKKTLDLGSPASAASLLSYKKPDPSPDMGSKRMKQLKTESGNAEPHIGRTAAASEKLAIETIRKSSPGMTLTKSSRKDTPTRRSVDPPEDPPAELPGRKVEQRVSPEASKSVKTLPPIAALEIEVQKLEAVPAPTQASKEIDEAPSPAADAGSDMDISSPEPEDDNKDGSDMDISADSNASVPGKTPPANMVAAKSTKEAATMPPKEVVIMTTSTEKTAYFATMQEMGTRKESSGNAVLRADSEGDKSCQAVTKDGPNGPVLNPTESNGKLGSDSDGDKQRPKIEQAAGISDQTSTVAPIEQHDKGSLSSEKNAGIRKEDPTIVGESKSKPPAETPQEMAASQSETANDGNAGSKKELVPSVKDHEPTGAKFDIQSNMDGVVAANGASEVTKTVAATAFVHPSFPQTSTKNSGDEGSCHKTLEQTDAPTGKVTSVGFSDGNDKKSPEFQLMQLPPGVAVQGQDFGGNTKVDKLTEDNALTSTAVDKKASSTLAPESKGCEAESIPSGAKDPEIVPGAEPACFPGEGVRATPPAPTGIAGDVKDIKTINEEPEAVVAMQRQDNGQRPDSVEAAVKEPGASVVKMQLPDSGDQAKTDEEASKANSHDTIRKSEEEKKERETLVVLTCQSEGGTGRNQDATVAQAEVVAVPGDRKDRKEAPVEVVQESAQEENKVIPTSMEAKKDKTSEAGVPLQKSEVGSKEKAGDGQNAASQESQQQGSEEGATTPLKKPGMVEKCEGNLTSSLSTVSKPEAKPTPSQEKNEEFLPVGGPSLRTAEFKAPERTPSTAQQGTESPASPCKPVEKSDVTEKSAKEAPGSAAVEPEALADDSQGTATANVADKAEAADRTIQADKPMAATKPLIKSGASSSDNITSVDGSPAQVSAGGGSRDKASPPKMSEVAKRFARAKLPTQASLSPKSSGTNQANGAASDLQHGKTKVSAGDATEKSMPKGTASSSLLKPLPSTMAKSDSLSSGSGTKGEVGKGKTGKRKSKKAKEAVAILNLVQTHTKGAGKTKKKSQPEGQPKAKRQKVGTCAASKHKPAKHILPTATATATMRSGQEVISRTQRTHRRGSADPPGISHASSKVAPSNRNRKAVPVAHHAQSKALPPRASSHDKASAAAQIAALARQIAPGRRDLNFPGRESHVPPAKTSKLHQAKSKAPKGNIQEASASVGTHSRIRHSPVVGSPTNSSYKAQVPLGQGSYKFQWGQRNATAPQPPRGSPGGGIYDDATESGTRAVANPPARRAGAPAPPLPQRGTKNVPARFAAQAPHIAQQRTGPNMRRMSGTAPPSPVLQRVPPPGMAPQGFHPHGFPPPGPHIPPHQRSLHQQQMGREAAEAQAMFFGLRRPGASAAFPGAGRMPPMAANGVPAQGMPFGLSPAQLVAAAHLGIVPHQQPPQAPPQRRPSGPNSVNSLYSYFQQNQPRRPGGMDPPGVSPPKKGGRK